ncbi:ArsR/SmtB family transcription factor [Breznakiella homolactica]|uniref:Winged helix-turn-helix transcriptional regulator n=1 Tax=Breznakiella homolactica TaxID=2798577 RepID=A0A7T8B8Q9_9SPIR|nr:metalloregulator ArsR/SmtB family transcription factor [Breznakiella homolactica]QQO07566.1 metalloregulator ArsR/SmtB family transcription factor [Breznakiella homolactica]
MKSSFAEYALLFKALSDETRLRIFSMLSDEERCACDILEEVNITQPTLSYHMKMLCDCGLANSRKDGQWVKYTVNRERVKQLEEFLEELPQFEKSREKKK